MKRLYKVLALSVFVISFNVKATPQKEFIMSCTYGVLAGTLVGAATLAFEEQPGENLNKVARGASLGLYLGMALGAYVVYVVPKQLEKENDIYQQPGYPGNEDGGGYDDAGYQDEYSFNNGLQVYPMITEKDIGVAANWDLLSF